MSLTFMKWPVGVRLDIVGIRLTPCLPTMNSRSGILLADNISFLEIDLQLMLAY